MAGYKAYNMLATYGGCRLTAGKKLTFGGPVGYKACKMLAT
jgi:hypothetical protein